MPIVELNDVPIGACREGFDHTFDIVEFRSIDEMESNLRSLVPGASLASDSMVLVNAADMHMRAVRR